jgi:ABC-type polysaccharide/polyol phosphate export permease
MLKNTLFDYRDTIFYLSILEFKVRYSGTILGFIWSVIEPLAQLAVLYVVFSFLFPSDDNLIIHLFTGLIMIQFFSRSTTQGMFSLFLKKPIILSINIPKMIFPFSSVLTQLWMFLIEISILFIFIIYFNLEISLSYIFLIPIFGLLIVLTIGISILLSVVVSYLRDFQTVWSIITMSLIFITPVFWNVSDMPKEISDVFLLNPLASLMEMAHQIILFNEVPSSFDIFYTSSISFGVLFLALFIFKKTEKKLVELF